MLKDSMGQEFRHSAVGMAPQCLGAQLGRLNGRRQRGKCDSMSGGHKDSHIWQLILAIV